METIAKPSGTRGRSTDILEQGEHKLNEQMMEHGTAVIGRLNEQLMEHSAALLRTAMEHSVAMGEEAMNGSVMKRSLDYCDFQMEELRSQKRRR